MFGTMNRNGMMAAAALVLAAGAAASAETVDRKTGLTPGEQIRCSYQVTVGSNSQVFDSTKTVAADGSVTFTKAPGTLNWVYYYNQTNGKLVSALDPTGNGNLWDSIHVGDRFALFGGSLGTLSTVIATDQYIQDPSVIVGQAFSFSNGLCAALPGATVLMNGNPFSGVASVSGFNEVQSVPTPGALALLGGAGLLAARRRRRV